MLDQQLGSNIKPFVENLKQTPLCELLKEIFTDYTEIKIEDSGYITFVNTEKEEAEQPKIIEKPAKAKKGIVVEEEEEKKKGGPAAVDDDINYT